MVLTHSSLVWRRLAALHEEDTAPVLWAVGFTERCADVVCKIALQIGFVSATRIGGYILLKRGGSSPVSLQSGVSTSDVNTVDAFVIQKVEENLRRCLVDFSRRRDRYVDLCMHWYPLPVSTVISICQRIAAQLRLQCQNLKTAIRIYKQIMMNPKERLHQPVLYSFPGPVIYIKQLTDAEFCCSLLRRHKVGLFGFDTEWKPNKRSSDDHPTALLQLCCRTPTDLRTGCLELPTARGSQYICFLLHIVHYGINPSLKSLLSDTDVIKAGLEIGGDVKKLGDHYGIEMKRAAELYEEAIEKGGIFVRGLRSLFRAAVGCDYPKDKSITTSNWECIPLSEVQQNYAACDAFAALRIYEELNQFE